VSSSEFLEAFTENLPEVGKQKLLRIHGIQPMPAFIGAWPEQASYGPIRARLNPTMPIDKSVDGAYYHGQDGTMDFGSTHGCLCYGKDTTMIQYIWDHRIDVHVAVDVPVETPQP
jgi:hypothetical protein